MTRNTSSRLLFACCCPASFTVVSALSSWRLSRQLLFSPTCPSSRLCPGRAFMSWRVTIHLSQTGTWPVCPSKWWVNAGKIRIDNVVFAWKKGGVIVINLLAYALIDNFQFKLLFIVKLKVNNTDRVILLLFSRDNVAAGFTKYNL